MNLTAYILRFINDECNSNETFTKDDGLRLRDHDNQLKNIKRLTIYLL